MSDKTPVARCTYIPMQHATNPLDDATPRATPMQQGQQIGLISLAHRVLERNRQRNEDATSPQNRATDHATDEVCVATGVASQWGEHSDLIRWFQDNSSIIPESSFCLWRSEHGSVHWKTPTASIRNIMEEIGNGPQGQYVEEVISIIGQLKAFTDGGE